MGQQNQFEPGDKVPNNGWYVEIGERSEVTGITNPRRVHLQRGDRFPDTANEDRKWTRVRN
jgi:hypothetical protein